MTRVFVSFFTGLILLFAGTDAARAISMVARDFDQLVTRADTVFKGTVTAKTSQWTGENSTRRIVTRVSFHVEETYKGESLPDQTLQFLGGTVGDDTMEVPDMPQFEVGQKAVLFVVGNGKQYCPLVGITQGRYHVVKETATGRERIFTDDFSPVSRTADIGKVDASGVPLLRRTARANAAGTGASASEAMAADDFRAEVLGKVAALPH